MTKPSVPTFLVAGAGRSGTTGLVEGLRTHPRVFVTQPKEPHYFALHGQQADFRGPGDAATINRVAVTDRDRYLDLFPAEHDFLALGDGSVSTLYYASRAIDEIRRINPQMRLVVILRDPVARAYSSYLYMRSRGFEPCEDVLEALADEPRRREQNWHHLWHYETMSHYAADLATLQQALGRDRVGVWFHDDLVADYAGTVSSVLRFLGLPPDPAEGVDVPRVNVSGTPRLPVVQNAIVAATRNELLRHTVKRMTSFRLRERIRRSSLRPSSVPVEVQRHFEGIFDADRVALTSLVSGRVPDWLRDALPMRRGAAAEGGDRDTGQ
ncbi:MAG: sulfotransferase [Actinomycetota bacterium]|nr:sulfotransferase [Actinomycetota bacterium]MDQ3421890.1 sulfotransferase [Actinomycetota bacterium]